MYIEKVPHSAPETEMADICSIILVKLSVCDKVKQGEIKQVSFNQQVKNLKENSTGYHGSSPAFDMPCRQVPVLPFHVVCATMV
jgi:hypothetical protein